MRVFKRGNANRVKLFTWFSIVPMPVVAYLLFGLFSFFVNSEYKEISIIDVVFRYVFTIVVTGMLYLFIIGFPIDSLRKRKDKYQVIRFMYHYNKCVEAFGNMDVQKVKIIYNNRIKDVKVTNVALQPLKDRIKFGYNIMSCKSEKEIITPNKRYTKK